MPVTLPEAETQEQTSTEKKNAPLYNVIIFDDDEHSYAYVVEMMMNLFAMTPEEGFDVAYTVDHIGEATVMTVPHEEALEAYHKIIGYGPDHRMQNSKGSMSCTIKPADE
ncbi:MAG: ATP-dependent Clp protease adaptor ClpS [Sumerlaeia bacterium]